MNILLWVLQVLLAVAFFAHGWMLLKGKFLKMKRTLSPYSFNIWVSIVV